MIKNYLKLDDRIPFFSRYVFVDTADHLYEQIIYNYDVCIRGLKEFVRDDTKIRLFFCRVKKRDSERFEKAISEIRKKAILRGEPDYDDVCKMLQTRDVR